MNTPPHSPNPPQRRPSLGVAAISHNEEKDLPGFLQNLLPWVDEIIIVDDGSTDHTRQLALAAGNKVRFIESPREPGQYYSHQRNKGIDHATTDWLLHMDIDERVPPDLAREILEAIRSEAHDGYRFRRLNFFLHRPMSGGGWQNWNLVHLARRPLFRFGGKMHETCLLDAPPSRVGQLEHKMWHLADSDYVERIRKNTVYMQIEAENLQERGVTVRWFDFLIQPLRRVFQSYFLQGGFRDGVPGLLYAMFVLTGTFNWYATAWDRSNAIPRNNLEGQLQELWLQQEPKA